MLAKRKGRQVYSGPKGALGSSVTRRPKGERAQAGPLGSRKEQGSKERRYERWQNRCRGLKPSKRPAGGECCAICGGVDDYQLHPESTEEHGKPLEISQTCSGERNTVCAVEKCCVHIPTRQCVWRNAINSQFDNRRLLVVSLARFPGVELSPRKGKTH